MNINLRPKNCSGQNLYGRYYSRCLTGDDTWRDEWISVLIQELNMRQELQKVRVEDMQYVGDTQSISSKRLEVMQNKMNIHQTVRVEAPTLGDQPG